MAINDYQIFVSHGSHDIWLATQISKTISDVGAIAFLDEKNIPKGRDFKKRIYQEIKKSHELVVLFTPWSINRSWIWIEIGAAWIQDMPIVAVFYGVTADDLEKNDQGKAVLEDINILEINDFDDYLQELEVRVGEIQK